MKRTRCIYIKSCFLVDMDFWLSLWEVDRLVFGWNLQLFCRYLAILTHPLRTFATMLYMGHFLLAAFKEIWIGSQLATSTSGIIFFRHCSFETQYVWAMLPNVPLWSSSPHKRGPSRRTWSRSYKLLLKKGVRYCNLSPFFFSHELIEMHETWKKTYYILRLN